MYRSGTGNTEQMDKYVVKESPYLNHIDREKVSRYVTKNKLVFQVSILV